MSPARTVAAEVRVLALAGISVGVIVAGVGSRLAMALLRATSADTVDGVTSDDGFEIGRVTLGGTYNLLSLGALVGVIGAAAYQWVRPALLGPRWFRVATVATAAGAVVGAMLVHGDGIDFTVLTPTWLAIGLFIALPALFGATMAVVVDRVDGRPPGPGRRPWVVPVVLVVLFPASLVALVPATAVLAAWVGVRPPAGEDWFADHPKAAVAVRGGWLMVAGLGAVALVGDVADIYSVT